MVSSKLIDWRFVTIFFLAFDHSWHHCVSGRWKLCPLHWIRDWFGSLVLSVLVQHFGHSRLLHLVSSQVQRSKRIPGNVHESGLAWSRWGDAPTIYKEIVNRVHFKRCMVRHSSLWIFLSQYCCDVAKAGCILWERHAFGVLDTSATFFPWIHMDFTR